MGLQPFSLRNKVPAVAVNIYYLLKFTLRVWLNISHLLIQFESNGI